MARSRPPAARAVTSTPTPRTDAFSAVPRPASRAPLALPNGARPAHAASRKASSPFWARARRLFWSWWVWALLCLWAMATDRWGWAAGTGAMALVSYLITPSEFPPRYGLDHELSVDDDEFLPTMAGATGVPFRARQPDRHPQQRRRVLSRHARGRSTAPRCRSRSRPTSTGRETSAASSPRRWRRRRRQACGSRSCSTQSGPPASARRSCETLERGRCQLAWYNPIRYYSLGRFNHRTHRKSLIVDGRIAFTGGAGIADHWRGNARNPERVARHADPDRRPGCRRRCRPASRRTGCRRPAS